MYIAQCHCKNIEIKIQHLPESLTQCNCSACYRYGALWGYYTAAETTLFINGKPCALMSGDNHPDLTSYSWGDKFILFHSCRKCGCMTHYSSSKKHQAQAGHNEYSSKVAINFRMVSGLATDEITIRRFDGADTWKFIE